MYYIYIYYIIYINKAMFAKPETDPPSRIAAGYFTNYFSVGMDAATAFEVAKVRSSRFGRCCFRSLAKGPPGAKRIC